MALCYSYIALDDEREEMLDKLNRKRRANRMVDRAVVHKRKAKSFKCSYCDCVT